MINDLAMACDDSAVASASDDKVVRVWGMQVGGGGGITTYIRKMFGWGIERCVACRGQV